MMRAAAWTELISLRLRLTGRVCGSNSFRGCDQGWFAAEEGGAALIRVEARSRGYDHDKYHPAAPEGESGR
jgi:hypothetical protein